MRLDEGLYVNQIWIPQMPQVMCMYANHSVLVVVELRYLEFRYHSLEKGREEGIREGGRKEGREGEKDKRRKVGKEKGRKGEMKKRREEIRPTVLSEKNVKNQQK